MSKIALIQPDSPYLTNPLAFPSLGLLYISSYLKRNGFDHDFYDLTDGVEMPDTKADIFAFSCQITQYQDVLRIRDRLKKFNPWSLFVIGGAFPTHTQCNDFINVCGEGEESMLMIAKGALKVKYETDKHVDPNFFPNWDAIDLSRYGYGLEGKRCINLMTKRGNCPFHCSFCAKSEKGKSPLRMRSVENVMEEVDLLRGKGFGAVAIYDDDVLLDKKRDYKIFEGLRERGMPYRCMTRTDLATKQDLQKLKDTGCAEVAIGVESADAHIHEVVCRKGTKVQQATDFVRFAKSIGLRVKTYFIIGLPSESRETVEKTRRWLDQEKPENYDVSIFTPYPGSHIYNHKKDYDINWNQEELERIWYSGEAQYGDCAVSTSHLTAKDILSLKDELIANRGIGGSTDYWKKL